MPVGEPHPPASAWKRRTPAPVSVPTCIILCWGESYVSPQTPQFTQGAETSQFSLSSFLSLGCTEFHKDPRSRSSLNSNHAGHSHCPGSLYRPGTCLCSWYQPPSRNIHSVPIVLNLPPFPGIYIFHLEDPCWHSAESSGSPVCLLLGTGTSWHCQA